MNGTRYVEVPRPLESEHSALVKDERFLPFIRLDLRRWVQIDTGAAVGRLLLADAPARKAFAEGRYVLHASPEGGDEQALKVFLALNLTTLERMKREETNPDYATEQFGVNAIRYASYLKNTYPEDKEMLQRALPLYETALASGELTLIEQAHALNQYGQGLYAVGHPSEAVYVYRSALLKIQRQHAMPWLFDPLHADLLVNLSKSYDALGQKWQAKLARDEAKGYKGTRVEAWVPNTGEMSGL
jgi:tetratricopeptide (TPR) repeat protein